MSLTFITNSSKNHQLYWVFLSFVALSTINLFWSIFPQNSVCWRLFSMFWSSNPYFDSPKTRRSAFFDNISHTILAAMSSIEFQFYRSCRKIEIIVNDEHIFMTDFIKRHDFLYSTSRFIHKRIRFDKKTLSLFDHALCNRGVKFFLWQKRRGFKCFTHHIQCQPSCIMSCKCIFCSWIS